MATEVFEDAIDEVFDEDGTEEATYYETEESEGVSVRVNRKIVDERAGILGVDARVPGDGLYVRVSEIATRPPEGALFGIGAKTFKVRTTQLDALGVVWECDLDEVPTS